MPETEFYSFEPDWTLTPGVILSEILVDRDLTAAHLARHGLCHSFVQRLLCGQAVLGTYAAARLEAALGIPARFWLNLETDYRDGLASGKHVYY